MVNELRGESPQADRNELPSSFHTQSAERMSCRLTIQAWQARCTCINQRPRILNVHERFLQCPCRVLGTAMCPKASKKKHEGGQSKYSRNAMNNIFLTHFSKALCWPASKALISSQGWLLRGSG
eukprot:gnl/TRDRNA2_/TRDRNA2_119366_c1_seq1.p1 gnl/TRDRNA2_/TRDRNA2_119366_c1~~gnl/TRDRNA2_/TRDRNA2_119366_c1_seq1.p1  ORF type:complete len:124 (+),score=3.28 gnl/TRDRNA2_/TRDRNA2_119366_c1_seq1:141-512(+)